MGSSFAQRKPKLSLRLWRRIVRLLRWFGTSGEGRILSALLVVAGVGSVGSFVGEHHDVNFLPASSFGSVGEWVGGVASAGALLYLVKQLTDAKSQHDDEIKKLQAHHDEQMKLQHTAIALQSEELRLEKHRREKEGLIGLVKVVGTARSIKDQPEPLKKFALELREAALRANYLHLDALGKKLQETTNDWTGWPFSKYSKARFLSEIRELVYELEIDQPSADQQNRLDELLGISVEPRMELLKEWHQDSAKDWFKRPDTYVFGSVRPTHLYRRRGVDHLIPMASEWGVPPRLVVAINLVVRESQNDSEVAFALQTLESFMTFPPEYLMSLGLDEVVVLKSVMNSKSGTPRPYTIREALARLGISVEAVDPKPRLI